MRVLECVCGELLRAETDDELFARVHEHVDRHHPELRFGKELLRTIVANVAYHEEITEKGARRCSGAAETRIDRKDFEVIPDVTGFGAAVGNEAAVYGRGETVEQGKSGMTAEVLGRPAPMDRSSAHRRSCSATSVRS